MKIYLLRHGETEWNRQEILQGRTDIPLNSTGRKQALMWAYYFEDKKVDVIISSPLLRAKETAEIIFARKKTAQILMERQFVEKDYGKATGLKKEVRERIYPDRNYEKMETSLDVMKRVSGALDKWVELYNYYDILIVCHSSVIKSIIQYITNVSDESRDMYGIYMSPLGITEIEFDKAYGYRLIKANTIELTIEENLEFEQ